ncbi:intradiol ring-cleavage dioxygenase [bacterium]|nr:MAG: intradiol ring-cleavage dioxygenase [bacterium]
MDNDDIPKGRILTRREALYLFGGAGLAFLTAAGCGGGGTGVTVPTTTPTTGATTSPTAVGTATATPISNTTCIVRPELTEGPYFVDERLLRSDIRSDSGTGTVQQGVLLNLTFNISQMADSGCSFLSGAMVDIWHANAAGKYSDIASEGTSGQNFLRGYQLTSSSGVAKFTTIFPGWYSGRAVHIHFKLRATVSGRSYEFTTQFFFDDSLSTSIYSASPYNTRGTRNTFNSNDGIYGQSGGETLMALTGSNSAGYSGTFNLALDV